MITNQRQEFNFLYKIYKSQQSEVNKTEKFNKLLHNLFCLYQISRLATSIYLSLKSGKIQRQGSLCLDVASPDEFCTVHIDLI